MKTVGRILVLATVLLVALAGAAAAAERPFRSSWSWPTQLDPATGSDFSSTTAIGNLYDTLVFPDQEGAPKPHLAESWTISEDGLTWAFKIRSGVKFHNGDPLTAEDVKFSLERLMTIGEGYAYLFSGKVESVAAPDAQTVTVKLKKPFGPFLSILYRLYVVNKKQVEAKIVKPGPYGDRGDFGKKFLLNNDAGSGPYMVKEFKVEERLVMDLFPGYWQELDKNVPDEYTMIGTTEAVTIRTLMSRRELEVSDQWQATENLAALAKIEGVKIGQIPQPGQFYFMIHTKKPPTDDIHFRKAMAYALDYQTVTTHLFPGTPQARGPIAAMIPGFDKTVFQYTRDLEKAKAELAQSKYADDFKNQKVIIHWVAEVPDEEKVALLFMSNMADIGLNVEVVKVPWATVVEETGAMDTSPNIVTIFDNASYPEAGALLTSRYTSGSAKTWEQNEWLLDENYDKMVNEALETMDRTERFKKYGALQHYIVDQCPTLFMFDQLSKYAYQASYIDWPAGEGKAIPVFGYELLGRGIKVFPEKKPK